MLGFEVGASTGHKDTCIGKGISLVPVIATGDL
jgi:hypothetical protein